MEEDSVHLHETKQTPHAPHHLVTKIRFQVLVRAATGDDADPVVAAHLYRILRDAGHTSRKTGFGAHHAMHPDMLDSQVHTLLDNLIGYLGIGKDEDRVRFFRDGFQVRVTGVSFKCGNSRIDAIDCITRLLETIVGFVAARFTFVGDADYGNSFLS